MFIAQAEDQGSHQDFVGGGVEDGAEDAGHSMGIHAGEFAIAPVRDGTVKEQAAAKQMVVVDDRVAQQRTQYDAGGCE